MRAPSQGYEFLPETYFHIKTQLAVLGFSFSFQLLNGFRFLQPTSFSLLAQLLNTEFLQLEFLERVTDDLILTIRPDETSKSAVDRFNLLVKCVRGIQRDIFQQKSKITRQFGSDDDARDNWFALDAYVTQQRRLKLLQLSGDPSNTIFADFDDTGNAELEKKGEEKACDVFMSKKLEERYNEQLSKAQGTSSNVMLTSVGKFQSFYYLTFLFPIHTLSFNSHRCIAIQRYSGCLSIFIHYLKLR